MSRLVTEIGSTRGEVVEHVDDYHFGVEEHEVFVNRQFVGRDVPLKIPRMRAIVRTDTEEVLGTVKSNYKVLTHEEALDPILERLEGKTKVHKRIMLTHGGARMYANLYFPGSQKSMQKGDNIWPGVNIMNAVDGSLKYMAEATIYRLYCTNGMRVPVRIAAMQQLHSKRADWDDAVERIIEIVGDDSLFSTFQTWANMTVSAEAALAHIDKIIQNKKCNFPPRYKDLVLGELETEKGYEGHLTAWNVYNAFNSVLEHNIIREKGRYERARLLDSNLFAVCQKAFK
jgi:hypothetical protein